MVEFAAVLVVCALVGCYLVWSERSENGGVYFWQRSSLLANGAQASGRVLDQATHSPSMARRTRVHLVDLVVEFTPAGGAPMRVPLRYRLAVEATSDRVQAGETVPLRYDPRRPTRVLIDWPAIEGGQRREPDQEQMRKDRERQEALLRGEQR